MVDISYGGDMVGIAQLRGEERGNGPRNAHTPRYSPGAAVSRPIFFWRLGAAWGNRRDRYRAKPYETKRETTGPRTNGPIDEPEALSIYQSSGVPICQFTVLSIYREFYRPIDLSIGRTAT